MYVSHSLCSVYELTQIPRKISRHPLCCSLMAGLAYAGNQVHQASRCSSHLTRQLTALSRIIQKARQNPKAVAQLDGYKRSLVGSLSANLQRFGMEKVGKLESLQEIIAEMTDTAGTSEKTSPGYSGQTTRM